MKLKNLSLMLITLVFSAVAVMVSVAAYTYSWFNANYQFKHNYLIPSNSMVVLSFDAPINAEEGALAPAILKAGAVAANKQDDIDYLKKAATTIEFYTSFVYYIGDNSINNAVGVGISATNTYISDSRDLVANAEIAVTIDFDILGQVVRYDSLGGFKVLDGTNWTPLLNKAAYIDNSGLQIVDASDYSIDANKTIFFDDYIFVPADISIPIKVIAQMTTAEEFTAPDLKNTVISIKLTLTAPEFGGE
ncbi:MAG: hypothetical protein LBU04_03140 [Christensenellaceae bacterium]|jgi:hypothetical protein|nr:hypothetical protein [Christensenellaceae bacterium]